jgi:SAM-dependent methyltransferase
MLRSEAPDDVRRYVDGGLGAVDYVTAALAQAGTTPAGVVSCLDLPSGYGRVTRHLVRHIAPERITAGDADRQAVRFCVRQFGVRGFECDRDPTRMIFPDRYDLIFVGSLLTHLPEGACLGLLDAVSGALLPGGILVFTTQGESCLRHLAWYGPEFASAEATYRREIRERGMCFVPYRRKRLPSLQSPTDRAYGITLHARTYVETALARRGLALLAVHERAGRPTRMSGRTAWADRWVASARRAWRLLLQATYGPIRSRPMLA